MHEMLEAVRTRSDRDTIQKNRFRDPGTVTCFGVLIAAINPYSKEIYILDEIYETDQRETSTRKIYPRSEAKALELYPGSNIHDDFIKTADEAAAWYMNEVMDQFGVYFSPTSKNHNKKEDGISLIKDIMLFNLIQISDRCTNLAIEIDKYALDDRGNIPKKHDHLIDCLRYLLAAAHYNMHEMLEAVRTRSDRDTIQKNRFRDPGEDEEPKDWMANVFKDWT
jgi:hypothetical protein